MILHCPFLENVRGIMLEQINDVERKYDVRVFSPFVNNLLLMLGKMPDGVPHEMMMDIYTIIATNVHKMYMVTVKSREGVG